MKKVYNACAVCDADCNGNCHSRGKLLVAWHCDRCGSDITGDEMFNDGENDLCLDCLKEEFRKEQDE